MAWWNVFRRLSRLEHREETVMAQIDDLKAAQARLIEANRRLIGKVGELQAVHVDQTEMQALIDDANSAAANAEAVAPPPAEAVEQPAAA
ncbi:MAG: hypothetical protein ACR652_21185 [Methylocystis sp.]|uniref:hypothetical protein n=1 Tax=Methylocystis sp. TaxID=1911079 RepID=UPI003DA47405